MKIYGTFLKVLATFIVFVAGSGVGPFCLFTTYEPDVPKALQK